MRAIVLREFGPPERLVLEDVPSPLAGGRFCAFGAAGGSFARLPDGERGVTLVRMGRPTREEALELTRSALAEAVAGRLRPVIGQTFALERAADAHAAIEARAAVGKTLLTV